MEEVTHMQRLLWQPGPAAAGVEVIARVILPKAAPVTGASGVDTRPGSRKGCCNQKGKVPAMGLIPGCYG